MAVVVLVLDGNSELVTSSPVYSGVTYREPAGSVRFCDLVFFFLMFFPVCKKLRNALKTHTRRQERCLLSPSGQQELFHKMLCNENIQSDTSVVARTTLQIPTAAVLVCSRSSCCLPAPVYSTSS